MRYCRAVLWLVSLMVVGAGYLVTFANVGAMSGPTIARVVEQSGKRTSLRVLFLYGSTKWGSSFEFGRRV
jgi:hypothetical protein